MIILIYLKPLKNVKKKLSDLVPKIIIIIQYMYATYNNYVRHIVNMIIINLCPFGDC